MSFRTQTYQADTLSAQAFYDFLFHFLYVEHQDFMRPRRRPKRPTGCNFLSGQALPGSKHARLDGLKTRRRTSRIRLVDPRGRLPVGRTTWEVDRPRLTGPVGEPAGTGPVDFAGGLH